MALRYCKMISALLATVGLLAWAAHLEAASIINADVTGTLGPAFFVDEAATGGSDVTVNQPSVGSYARNFSGLLTPNQGRTGISITGFGFATLNNFTNNDATSLAVSFTYLGADGVTGGGDDVFIGTATGSYFFDTNAEYAFAFDTPLNATLNITGVRFLIQVTPTNSAGTGSVSFKTAALAYEGTSGPKFSVAGTATARRVNLAKYQLTTAATENGQYTAAYATDGVVGNDNSWRTASVNSAHWVEVAFPISITAGSAQIYSGTNDGPALAGFKVQYFTNGNWSDVPGSSVAANTSIERNVLFSSPVTAARFRLYSDENGSQRVREFALYPPNPTNGVEQGFPLGSDVDLNLAKQRPAVASAISSNNYPKLAVDGLVNDQSKWQTTLAGSNTLEVDLRVSTKIGSVHLYSGATGIPVITNFVLQYWTNNSWVAIPGGSIAGNTSAVCVVNFSSPPITTRVQLVFTNPAVSAVRELCVFPANGGAGYAPGRGVTGAVPPPSWETFNDAYYELRNRAANLPVGVISNAPLLVATNQTGQLSQYQLLLNLGTDTYRLRNRATGKCLAGAGLSTNAGALLVDEDYTGMPHQNWRRLAYAATDFYLINEWSSLMLDTQAGATIPGTALVQNASNGTASQRWRADFQSRYPRKGSAGFVSLWQSHRANWSYNWGRTDASQSNLPASVIFNPMQWGNFNWDIGSSQGPVEQYRSGWRREDKAMYYLGFNEPDGADQANLTVDQAIELWPRLERMDMPLLSPAPVNPLNTWMTTFMSQAASRGYRMDAVAAHKYPGPNGGDPSALISELRAVNTTWGQPVWLTEFSTVDWSGTNTWTQEDNYNWLAEFMWRAESLSWLRRYSLFLFTANTTDYAEPANPWDKVGPRSNAFDTNGTHTSFGELYFAWDCDANVRGDKAYFIHNKSERKRIRNAVGSSAPSQGSIREGTNTTQWVLRAGPAAGQWYITSLRDGRRLRYSSSVLDFAPAGTTGSAVTWTLTENTNGWFYVEHPAAPAANRRLSLANTNIFSMASNTNTTDQVKWRFVVPYAPGNAALPLAPVNLTAVAGTNQVSLNWASGGTSNVTYWIYRGTSSGGTYSLIASNQPAPSHLDTSSLNGTTYYYVVTAKDALAAESPYSNEASATPVLPLPNTPTNIIFTVSNNTLVLNWPSNYTGWLLQTQTNTLNSGLGPNWFTLPGSETNNSFTAPLNPAHPAGFFRLKRP